MVLNVLRYKLLEASETDCIIGGGPDKACRNISVSVLILIHLMP